MGGGEIVLIVFVALLFFGADAIPGIAKTLGKAMREFQKATDEIKREINISETGIGGDFSDIKSTIMNARNDIQEGIRKHTGDITSTVNDLGDEVKKGTETISNEVQYGSEQIDHDIKYGSEPKAPEVKKEIDFTI